MAKLIQYMPAGVIFEWDPKKAASNLKKHGINFREAATVLDDDLSTTFRIRIIRSPNGVMSPLECPVKIVYW